MAGSSEAQRIPPLEIDAWAELSKELPANLARDDEAPLRILTTLGRHGVLLRSWLRFAGRLTAGTLLPRWRELVVLRTVWRCRGEYEWGPHVAAAHAVGLTDDEIRRIVVGPQAWDEREVEQALLRAVDQLHDTATIDDRVWAKLATRLDHQQLIELPMLVGQYHLASFVVNALRISAEPDAARLPNELGLVDSMSGQ